MPYLLIDPGEKLDYSCDWAAFLDDAGSPSDTIGTSSWSITPQSGSPLQPNLSGSLLSGTKTTVFVDSALRGEVYLLTNRVTTAQGRTAERSITIRCENR